MSGQPQARNAEDAPLERVQELTWALLEEQISADEFSELDRALLNDVQAREAYIACVQLHADLSLHFAGEAIPPASTSSKSPVLGFLNAGMPPLGLQSNPAADASL